jgi:hypothetical protein
MNLKDILRQIDADARDRFQILDRLAHGRLPLRWVGDNNHLATSDAVRAPPAPSP